MLRRSSITLAVAAVAIVACANGARNGSAQSPVELQIGKIADLQDAGVNTSSARNDSRCSVRLVASRIEKSSPGCYLDEHVSRGPGLLYYPCEGDGPAEADFGEQRYTGQLRKGEVLVELLTELDWEDGCRWGTRAAISGRVTSGSGSEPTLGRLKWDYLDRIITGSSCSGICTARSTFAVSANTKGANDRKPQDDDDDDALPDDGD